jgi:uncharacterized hydantoinase/oxoprolinase family protein
MANKLSNIIKEIQISDSKSYNELSPTMKSAINDFYKELDKESKDIIKDFESTVEKVAKYHNLNKDALYEFFAKEVKEQLGAN